MHRLICILLALLLLPLVGTAEMDQQAKEELVRLQVEQAMAGWVKEESPWTAAAFSFAAVEDVSSGKKGEVTVTVALPTMKRPTDVNEKPEDWADYFCRSMAGYLAPENFRPIAVTATIDAEGQVVWSSGKGLNSLLQAGRNAVKAAKPGYGTKTMLQALSHVVIPRSTVMPKTKPQDPEEVPELKDVSGAIQKTLGAEAWTEEEQLLLPALFMLLDITKMNTDTASLEAVEITLRAKDWEAMLTLAEELAKEVLPDLVGAPDMSREEVRAVLAAQLPQACLTRYYFKKTTSIPMTVSLPEIRRQGLRGAGPLYEYVQTYLASFESHLDGLMVYAADLPYYPSIPLIDTGILQGSEDETGSRVTFDLGGDTGHGFVRVFRQGKVILEGFIQQGDRLAVRLQPGEYTVQYAKGPEWYGEQFWFGEQGEYGSFTITSVQGLRTAVHMKDTDGATAVTAESWHQWKERK